MLGTRISDISFKIFGGGHVGADEGLGYVWDVHASSVVYHGGGMEMSSRDLAWSKDHFDISYLCFGGGQSRLQTC